MYGLNLFTEKNEDLKNFLNKFYEKNIVTNNEALDFEENYENPIDMIPIISTLIDNNDKFNIGIWITLDSDIYINITENNLYKIIKYIFERYPNITK